MNKVNVTVSIELDKRKIKKNQKYPVKILVYCEGSKERYSTGIDLSKDEWEKLYKPSLRDDNLKLIRRRLNSYKEKAETIIERMPEFTFARFEEEYFQEKQYRRSHLIADLFDEYINELNEKGRVGSASIYNTTKNSLLRFKQNLMLKDITREFLEEYESHLLQKGHSLTSSKLTEKAKRKLVENPSKMISPTTIGIYLRHLRAIINRAIKDKLLHADNYPFKEFEIPQSRNIKKSLSASQIKQLLSYQTDNLYHRKSLDFWLFSYISNGINFTDICLLRPENIQGEFFFYYRAKTKNTKKRDGRPIQVPLTPETKEIISRWRSNESNSPYLFPILEPGLSAKQIKYRIQDFINKVNKKMKEIGTILGIGEKIGTYVARHSHSTILKRSGASTEMIKENLGHASINTTESYLADFEDEVKIAFSRKLIDL